MKPQPVVSAHVMPNLIFITVIEADGTETAVTLARGANQGWTRERVAPVLVALMESWHAEDTSNDD